MKKTLNQLTFKFKNGSIVEKLIYLNLAVFILGFLTNTLSFLMSNQANFIFDWFALPAQYNALLLKPWTLFTYAFLHASLWHILANLIVLFYFGNLFLDYLTQRQFLTYYVLGALFGGLIFILSFNFFPALKNSNSVLVGASAAVTAIFVGIATYIPNYEINIRFIGFVKLWVLATIWVGLDVIQIPVNNAGGHLAHLGGALIGLILTYKPQNNFKFISYLTGLFSTQKKKPLKTVYKSTKKTEFSNREVNQKRIDAILDKISKSGYETLSKEEKDYLFKSGKS
ncbi:MAG: DUF1751 domain-containing protein [Flavobacteriales bacterium CG03_land_8_20_14_0_80_35_15]|nr:rhomboid family intramembrane serine protease [Zetaproteobacteria bacterium]NDK17461.1 rhomboid family intramembrane serine protease [Flavobacteriales bacterium]OIO11312.1 MAG: rhomboid family intramembrane serine protease [Flavobacteriaceae bacterium CG1_02_35_72]PIR13693.1 MAG: rhomboid family intramembrane serine protease [Flavobacteriales bacterium CG11_big_fil_rev_8_21_14_0_20_35_7]PIV17737.1 MAG: DUF1751 domain-containing protein [Flavobacteriales bacterium CG03_land_8_20_14_0_80_35_15